ncbi:MAG: YfcE family phosphodiesterase [Candidatus Omnitrophica bacterium]|nr:YfcE family phosphodiesterase [Candidatus Omnitrophota bacterium]
MKIALLADIHGNLPALESVLKDVHKQGCEEIWHLGDLVGYGPFPEQSVQRLCREKAMSIVGNYDLKVLEFKKKEDEWKEKKDPAKFFSFQWTHRQLSVSTKRYLAALPEKMVLQRQSVRFLLVHGSPEAIDEPLTKDTPRRRFQELASAVNADIVLCGHTHEYFLKTFNGKKFINPGSVGRPFDSDPRASYAVLTMENKKVQVKNIRIAYDVKRVAEKMKKEKFPEMLIRSLTTARSVDQLKKEDEAFQVKILSQALQLAQRCHYEKKHSHQVARIALELFDQLGELHGCGPSERLWLQLGSLLHDIGWIQGGFRHHKTARDLIMGAKELPLDPCARRVVALIARYHRGALPKRTHQCLDDLKPADQKIVKKLAALLRMADGLDRSHLNLIEAVDCECSSQKIKIILKAAQLPRAEMVYGKKKADLFKQVFRKDVEFCWQRSSAT